MKSTFMQDRAANNTIPRPISSNDEWRDVQEVWTADDNFSFAELGHGIGTDEISRGAEPSSSDSLP